MIADESRTPPRKKHASCLTETVLTSWPHCLTAVQT